MVLFLWCNGIVTVSDRRGVVKVLCILLLRLSRRVASVSCDSAAWWVALLVLVGLGGARVIEVMIVRCWCSIGW